MYAEGRIPPPPPKVSPKSPWNGIVDTPYPPTPVHLQLYVSSLDNRRKAARIVALVGPCSCIYLSAQVSLPSSTPWADDAELHIHPCNRITLIILFVLLLFYSSASFSQFMCLGSSKCNVALLIIPNTSSVLP